MSVVSPEDRTSKGFAWPKLFAAILIVGFLAAIAVPLYIDQMKQRHDARVQANLNTIASGILTAVAEEQDDAPALEVSGTTVALNGETIATLSPGVVLGDLEWVGPDEWCIDVRDPAGKHANDPGYMYKAADEKTKTGQCA